MFASFPTMHKSQNPCQNKNYFLTRVFDSFAGIPDLYLTEKADLMAEKENYRPSSTRLRARGICGK